MTSNWSNIILSCNIASLKFKLHLVTGIYYIEVTIHFSLNGLHLHLFNRRKEIKAHPTGTNYIGVVILHLHLFMNKQIYLRNYIY